MARELPLNKVGLAKSRFRPLLAFGPEPASYLLTPAALLSEGLEQRALGAVKPDFTANAWSSKEFPLHALRYLSHSLFRSWRSIENQELLIESTIQRQAQVDLARLACGYTPRRSRLPFLLMDNSGTQKKSSVGRVYPH